MLPLSPARQWAIEHQLRVGRFFDAADFVPVSQTVSMPQLLVVHPSVKATNLKELLALAKAKPGELNYSSSGTGSSSHLAMELLKYMTGINVVHVPFKGSGQAMPNLLAGQVQLVFDPMPSSLPHVKSGRLKALGISSLKRLPSLPDVPTARENGITDCDTTTWFAVLTTAGTPRPALARLHKELVGIVQTQEMTEKMRGAGVEPLTSTPEQLAAVMRADLSADLRDNLDRLAELVAASAADTVVDQFGQTLKIWDATAYNAAALPGNVGDVLLISGVPTMENFALRFRRDAAVAETIGDLLDEQRRDPGAIQRRPPFVAWQKRS